MRQHRQWPGLRNLKKRSRIVLAVYSFAVFSLVVFFGFNGQSEPWLANRYAQNCAACHSPARRNVIPSQRRCTLSCQGCHVNPNGGGLRNSYGMWNQQRWLRSFKSDFFRNKGTPAPLRYQKYWQEPIHLTAENVVQKYPEQSNEYREVASVVVRNGRRYIVHRRVRVPQRNMRRNMPPTDYRQLARDGARLVVLPGVDYNPRAYDRGDHQEDITVANRTEFMARVTDDDPYRQEHRQSVFAGAEYRYFYMNGKFSGDGTKAGTKVDFTGPMALDVGLRVRPIPDHLQLVAEDRYYNYPLPGQGNLEHSVTGGEAPRSLYALVDDLPYNTYVMYGLYKPLFGYYDPNHTSLLNTLLFANNQTSGGDSFDADTNRSATALYKAISIGGSPNVPFFNIHYIMPMDELTDSFHQDKGYALNLGGRFVSYGASVMFSYWDTKGPRAAGGPDLDNKMYGINAGATYKKLTANVDFSTIKREFAPGSADTGAVQTFDFKYRLWREIYAEANYASANVARNLKAGSATETSWGIRSFLLPGTDFELLMTSRDDKDKTNNLETKLTLTQAQIHIYF